MAETILFGVPAERMTAITRIYAEQLADLEKGALLALALDPVISPEEMIAVVKWGHIAGLAAARGAAFRLDVRDDIEETIRHLRRELLDIGGVVD